MEFVSFVAGTSLPKVGALDSHGKIVDFAAIETNFPQNIVNLIRAGDTAIVRAREIVDSAPPEVRFELNQVSLTAPIPRPNKNVFCVGRNYKEHVDEGHRARGTEINYPKAPQFFSKAPTAVIGPDEVVYLD